MVAFLASHSTTPVELAMAILSHYPLFGAITLSTTHHIACPAVLIFPLLAINFAPSSRRFIAVRRRSLQVDQISIGNWCQATVSWHQDAMRVYIFHCHFNGFLCLLSQRATNVTVRC